MAISRLEVIHKLEEGWTPNSRRAPYGLGRGTAMGMSPARHRGGRGGWPFTVGGWASRKDSSPGRKKICCLAFRGGVIDDLEWEYTTPLKVRGNDDENSKP